jgi:type II secretory pathway pseudopilin PulG
MTDSSRPGSATGLTLIELLVSISVVLLLAGVLLDRLLLYQEAAEKACIELEIVKLRVALQARIGALIAEHKVVDYGALARENPVKWLDEPMPGYRGELGPAEAQLMKGDAWYFDRASAQLVYVVNNGRYFVADSSGRKRIRLHAKLVRAESSGATEDSAVLGLQVTPVEPYRWM